MVGGRKWALLGLSVVVACASGDAGMGQPVPTSLGSADASDSSATTGGDPSTTSSAASTTEGSSESSTGPSATATSGASTSSGGECMVGADCPSGSCAFGGCQVVVSCADLLEKEPTTASGEYEIDPIGGAPYPVYCDMTTDGGGWTLVMKLTSDTNTLQYDASFWTTSDVLNPDDTTPNAAPAGSNAKLPSFNDVPGQALRLEWVEPSLTGHAFVFDALAGQTAVQLFSGGEITLGGNEGSGCNGEALQDEPGYLGEAMRHGRGRQFHGINGSDGGEDRLRYGFGSNDEEGNTWGAKQGIGVSDESIRWGSHDDCNNCGCYGEFFSARQVSANLWVR